MTPLISIRHAQELSHGHVLRQPFVNAAVIPNVYLMLGEPVRCVTQPTSLNPLYDPRSAPVSLTRTFSDVIDDTYRSNVWQ